MTSQVASTDGSVAKSVTTGSSSSSMVVELPEGHRTYTATLSWFDSKVSNRTTSRADTHKQQPLCHNDIT